MPCALTQNYVLDCRDSLGGIKSIRVAPWGDVQTLTVAAGVVTGITMRTGAKFYKYDLIKATSSAEEALQASVENGTLFYQPTVNIILNKMRTNTRNELLALAQNLLMVIVEDNNGAFWLYGRVNGMDVTAGGSATGTAMADRNGYTLTFTGMEPELAPSVTASILTAITA